MSNLVQSEIAQVDSPVGSKLQEQTPSMQTVVCMALELEKLTINQPLSPYSMAARALETLEQLQLNVPLTLTLDSFRYGVNPFGMSLFHRVPPCGGLEIDAIFRREEQPVEEKSEKLNEVSQLGRPRKGRHPGKSKLPVQVKTLEAGAGELYLRLDRHVSLHMEDRDETTLRKAKSASEPTTEDSASQTEMLSFPGLSGSLPSFKKALCHGCRQTRLVFWFGDSSAKRRGDRYSCTECLKTTMGEEKFLAFFRIESLWTQPAYADIAEAKPQPPLKEYVAKLEGEKVDAQSTALSYLLEEKKLSIQSALARMTACLNSCRSKVDLETQLFATRFLHDLLEDLIRIGFIGKQRCIEKKLECLDDAEKSFFLPEIKRVAAQVISLQEPKADSDLLALNSQVRLVTGGQSQWFSLDFDERHSLGKRDPWARSRVFYHDSLDHDQEAF